MTNEVVYDVEVGSYCVCLLLQGFNGLYLEFIESSIFSGIKDFIKLIWHSYCYNGMRTFNEQS